MSKLPVSTLLNALTTTDANNAAANFLAILNNSPHIDPSSEDSYALRWAIEKGHQKLVATLLKDERIDVNANHGYAFIAALKQPDVALFRMVSVHPLFDFRAIEFNHTKGALRCAVEFGTPKNLRAFLERYPWYQTSFSNLLRLAYEQLREPEVFTILLDTMGASALNALDLFEHLCVVQDLKRMQAILPFIEDELKANRDFAHKCWLIARLPELLHPYVVDPIYENESLRDIDVKPGGGVLTEPGVSELVNGAYSKEKLEASLYINVEPEGNDEDDMKTATTTTTVTLPDGTNLHLHIHVTVSQEPSQK